MAHDRIEQALGLAKRIDSLRQKVKEAQGELQRAEAEFVRNSMPESLGIAPTSQPLLHFARRQDVLVWPPQLLLAQRDGSSAS